MRLYPGKIRSDIPATIQAYREHQGIDEDGKLVLDRIVDACAGAVKKITREGSPTWPEGVEMVMKVEGNTRITEIIYPQAALYPLSLATGKEFRFTLMYYDRDTEDDPNSGKSKNWKAAGFGFQWTNVEGDPWGQYDFHLVE